MNRSKQKGSRLERQVADFLNEWWSDTIDRRPLAGSADRGDIANFRVGSEGHRVVVEVKNCARLDLAGWVAEAEAEAVNDSAVAGIVVAKRRGRGGPADQYVITTLGDFVKILHVASR